MVIKLRILQDVPYKTPDYFWIVLYKALRLYDAALPYG